VLKDVAAAAVAGARPLEHNRFKVALAQRAVMRALREAGQNA
jgi:CO/xanthine dehydrogenase FAD-binding subunit